MWRAVTSGKSRVGTSRSERSRTSVATSAIVVGVVALGAAIFGFTSYSNKQDAAKLAQPRQLPRGLRREVRSAVVPRRSAVDVEGQLPALGPAAGRRREAAVGAGVGHAV